MTTISLLPKIVYGCNPNRARSGAKNASRLGDWIFSIISGDSERGCTGCTLSERPHERTEKDIPKVVSDGEINPDVLSSQKIVVALVHKVFRA